MGALAAIAALGLAACVNNDASRSDVVNALTDADLPEDQAECIGDAMAGEQGSAGLAKVQEEGDIPGGFGGFTQEQLNDIAAADTPQEVDELEEGPIVDQIVNICTDGAAEAGTDTDAGATDDTDDEDTTTTTAEDDTDG